MDYLKSVISYFTESELPTCNELPMPVSSAFTSEELLNWDPETDYNAPFNVSTFPITKRANSMNSKVATFLGHKTSGQNSQGENTFNLFNPTYWQYTDICVYWAGSASEGFIVPPLKQWIDAAHLNGVKIYGNVYLVPTYYGGKLEWVKKLIQTDPKNKEIFPGADKLILMAKTYGFDGWFINQEIDGGQEELGLQVQAFIEYIRRTSDIEVMWYDAMLLDGSIDYQNEFNQYNAPFIKNGTENVSNSIFLNYDWDPGMIQSSQKEAIKIGVSPYQVYAGINVDSYGLGTANRMKNIYQNNQPLVSVGLYEQDWTFKCKPDITYQEFVKNDREFWEGISEMQSPRICLSKPFTTFFNRGQGLGYFIQGKQVSSDNWYDVSQQEMLPTYRFSDTMSFDYQKVYHGGSSLLISSEVASRQTVDLFETEIDLENCTCDLTYSLTGNAKVYLVLGYASGKTERLLLGYSDEWNTMTTSISNQTLYKISLEIVNDDAFNLWLGKLSFYQIQEIPSQPQGFEIKEQNGNATILQWQRDDSVWFYYVFVDNQFYGRTNNCVYYLTETGKTFTLQPFSFDGTSGIIATLQC